MSSCEENLNTLIQHHEHLSPFLIFHGEQGIGKSLTAQKFAASLLNIPFEHLQHPLHNYRYINFEKDDIKMDVLPLIRDFLEHKHDQYKILIIDHADHMNTHVANSVLKLFEQHFHKTFIILIVHNIHKFPKTLRSRFFEIAFDTSIQGDELSQYTQGNAKLLHWVLNHGGLSLIQKLKYLMSKKAITSEHESFIQEYKEDHTHILTLMKIILYLDKKVIPFLHLNRFIIQSHHTHIPLEDYLYMGFLSTLSTHQ